MSASASYVASALNGFALLLIVSAYMANLAATFTTAAPPARLVLGTSSFNPSVPVCARYSSTLAALLNGTYPVAASAWLPANTFQTSFQGSQAALQGVLAGQCAGAILPTPEASWLLDVNDTTGTLCELQARTRAAARVRERGCCNRSSRATSGAHPHAQALGNPIGDEGMPLTFSASALTASQLEAFDMAIEQLQRDGSFLARALSRTRAECVAGRAPPSSRARSPCRRAQTPLMAAYFPDAVTTVRPACAALDAQDAAAAAVLAPAAQLQVVDLAGAFMLQGVGLLLALLLHVSRHARTAAEAWLCGLCGRRPHVHAAASDGAKLDAEGASVDWDGSQRAAPLAATAHHHPHTRQPRREHHSAASDWPASPPPSFLPPLLPAPHASAAWSRAAAAGSPLSPAAFRDGGGAASATPDYYGYSRGGYASTY